MAAKNTVVALGDNETYSAARHYNAFMVTKARDSRSDHRHRIVRRMCVDQACARLFSRRSEIQEDVKDGWGRQSRQSVRGRVDNTGCARSPGETCQCTRASKPVGVRGSARFYNSGGPVYASTLLPMR